MNPGRGKIPPAAQKALEDAGIDIAVITCLDKNGAVQVLNATEVNEKPTVFPIQTTAIENITTISAVQYKGSTCITIMVNGDAQTYCW